jgi:pentose-5-phosphate-3-epimerase
MHTAIRLKQKITSDKLVISIPEIAKLNGREVEIIILVDGELENSSIPPKAIQNSSHVAGSIVLDEEAMQELMKTRFR